MLQRVWGLIGCDVVAGLRGLEQYSGVRMVGAPIEIGGRTYLDDPAEVHDGDHVADDSHHMEIVTDEQVGESQAFFEVEQEIDDLRLNRDIEGAGGLIRNDEIGLDTQGASDEESLTLSARELVRVSVDDIGAESDALTQSRDALWDSGLLAYPMHCQSFSECVRHGLPRVERGKRILGYELHASPHWAQRPSRHVGDISPRKDDSARRWAKQPQNAAAKCALATTGLAHQTEGLSAGNGQTDIVKRVQDIGATWGAHVKLL